MIHRYWLAKDKSLRVFNDLPDISVHNNEQRIMGLSVDHRVMKLFSISESGYVIVTDLNAGGRLGGKVIHSKNLAGASGLKSLVHDL